MKLLFKYLTILILISVSVVILRDLFLVHFSNYVWKPGTGFTGKTVWTWLDLLVVPLMIGLAASLLTWRQDTRNQEIALENLREKELQTYLETLSELILSQRLLRSRPNTEVRKLAAAHTLRVFRRLDTPRKQVLVQFLYEIGLINGNTPIIPMDHVDLQKVDLSGKDLSGINLCNANSERANFVETIMANCFLNDVKMDKANLVGALLNGSLLNHSDLCGAKFTGAQLIDAKLIGADLTGADLSGSNLEKANLYKAKVENFQLEKANSLVQCRLPSGKIYPGED